MLANRTMVFVAPDDNAVNVTFAVAVLHRVAWLSLTRHGSVPTSSTHGDTVAIRGPYGSGCRSGARRMGMLAAGGTVGSEDRGEPSED